MTVWPLPETAVIDGALWLRTVIVPLLAAVSTGVAPYRPDTAAVGVITKEPAVLLEKLRPAFAVDELGRDRSRRRQSDQRTAAGSECGQTREVYAIGIAVTPLFANPTVSAVEPPTISVELAGDALNV